MGYFFWVSFFGYGCHLSNFPCFRKSSHLKMNCSPVWKSLLRCSHNCLSGLVQRFYHILVLFSAAKFTLNDRLDVNFFYILKLKSFCFSVQASVNNSLPKTTFFISKPCSLVIKLALWVVSPPSDKKYCWIYLPKSHGPSKCLDI